MRGALFWNYYVTYLSLASHLIIHGLALGWWCSSSKLVFLYSAQVICLHAFSWAIPDRRYAAWVKKRCYWFYGVSSLNVVAYMIGIFGGLYLYKTSKDGLWQFTGISCLLYTFMSQSLMMLMFGVNYYTLSTRFAYENEKHNKKDTEK